MIVPAFRHHGGLSAFAAFDDHCSFFVMSPSAMEAHKTDVEGYKTSKGTIRFTADAPLPAALVKKSRRGSARTRHARWARAKASSECSRCGE